MFFKIEWCLFMFSILSIESCEIVYTSSGPVRGGVRFDPLVGSFRFYEGIPYAEAPVGDLRFKAPVPKTPWTEVYNATKFGPICPQLDSNETMSEDCLFLNVYVPGRIKEEDNQLMPVLVFVHGGEFTTFSGNTDQINGPQLILKRGVVFVSLNYRLGALGFLSLATEEAPGNAGLKDTLLALKWINENIAQFGGDPTRITLSGSSAGAASAHYLLLSEKSTNLFQQALLFSGSALSYRFQARHPRENALALAKQLNITADNDEELMQELYRIDAMDIVTAQKDIGANDLRKGYRPFAPFVPCVEIEHDNAIITKDPIDIIREGIPQNVPIMTGVDNKSGIKMLPVLKKKEAENLNDDFELCIPSNIEYPYASQESLDLARSMKNFYFNGKDISNETLGSFVDLVTDTMFAFPNDAFIKLHKAREDSNKIYYYVFGFDGALNYFKVTHNVSVPGASHGDTDGYVLVMKETMSRLENLDERNRRMLDTMVTVVTNFVKFGNPTPAKQDIGTIWRESSQDCNYIYLSDDDGTDTWKRMRNLQFWYIVYDQYRRYLESGGRVESKIVP